MLAAYAGERRVNAILAKDKLYAHSPHVTYTWYGANNRRDTALEPHPAEANRSPKERGGNLLIAIRPRQPSDVGALHCLFITQPWQHEPPRWAMGPRLSVREGAETTKDMV